MSIAEKLTTIAENVPKVYEAGAKSEYDRFWDAYQSNSSGFGYGVKPYYYAFAGSGWNDDTFKPKYNIKMRYSNISAFSYFEGTDLINLLKVAGVTLDTSEATSLSGLFAYSTVARIPTLDFRKASSLSNVFYECKSLLYVEKMLVGEKNTFSTNTFYGCNELIEIRFEGVIASDISLSHCGKLSYDSVDNIIDTLSDLTGGTAKTITWHSTVLDNLTVEQYTKITNKNWKLA